jgi:hypothetical protein
VKLEKLLLFVIERADGGIALRIDPELEEAFGIGDIRE